MSDNSFDNIMRSLLDGANGVLTSKTVVGAPVQVGDTTLIPLSDITIGCGAGSNTGESKNAGMGGFSAKMSPSAVLIIRDGNTRLVNIKDQNTISQLVEAIPELVDRITQSRGAKDGITDEEAAEAAFGAGKQEKREA